MSSLVFPALPLLNPKVTREPYYKTTVFESEAGNEQRVQRMASPRYIYKLKAHYRGAGWRTGLTPEVEAILGLHQRHAGALDSFLFKDPDDCLVTGQGFGIGNASTSIFQLQRTMPGPASNELGLVGPYTKRRTNLAPYSQTLASWSVANATVVSGLAAPDGTPTAVRLTDNATSGAHMISAAVATPYPAQGETFTLSLYVKADVGSVGVEFSIQGSGPGYNPCGIVGTITVPGGAVSAANSYGYPGQAAVGSSVAVGAGWYRVTVTGSWRFPAGATMYLAMVDQASSSYVGSGKSLLLWGAQVEAGSTATRHIPTTTAALSADPSYYPSITDGFEPVTEMRQALASEFSGLPSAFGSGAQALAATRTNLCIQSQAFDDGGWTKNTGVTVPSTTITDPQGGTTAESIAYDGTGTTGSSRIYRVGIVSPSVAGIVYAYSVWLKVPTTTTTVQIHSNLTNFTACVVTTAWQRFTVLGTGDGSTSIIVSIYSNTGDNAAWTIHAWGAQVELGATATTYIPTTTLPVTAFDSYPGDTSMDWQGARAPYGTPRTNLCSWSQAIEAWVRGGTATVAPGAIAGPDGISMAALLSFPATSDSWYHNTVLSSVFALGSTWTHSIYVKGTAGQTVRIVADGSGGTYESFYVTVTFTGAWQRVSLTVTMAQASHTASSLYVQRAVAGDATSCYAWGAQLESGSTATAYIPTTGGPATVPAEYDGSPTILASGDGLGTRKLAGYARTNLWLQSQTFQTTWATGGSSIVTDVAVAPDGTSTADKLMESAAGAGNINHSVRQDVTLTDSTRYVQSVYAKMTTGLPRGLFMQSRKRDGGYCNAGFNLAAGTNPYSDAVVSSGMTYVGNGWWRCWMCFDSLVGVTAPDSALYLALDGVTATYVGDAVSAIYIWGAQYEIGTAAGPGDYIVTTTGTVARTDYTLGAGTGLATLGLAARTGEQLSWLSGFYRRVRFADDKLTTNKIMAALWEGELSLVSVK